MVHSFDCLVSNKNFIRGQYSAAVLSELESQNDEHLEGMSAKVKMLKEVKKKKLFFISFPPSSLSLSLFLFLHTLLFLSFPFLFCPSSPPCPFSSISFP